MTRKELETLVGYPVTAKMQMVMGPDDRIYGRMEDDSWEPYLREGEPRESDDARR